MAISLVAKSNGLPGRKFHQPSLIAFRPPAAYFEGWTKGQDQSRMNWITNYVRPKINSLFSRREVPENLWTKCPECGTMLFHRELSGNLNVCSSCDHHMAISPRERFEALFDGGIFTEVKVPDPVADPLHFRDQKKYPDRVKAAQKASGEKDAMLVAEGEVLRTPIIAAAQDLSCMAGSMGMYAATALIPADASPEDKARLLDGFRKLGIDV